MIKYKRFTKTCIKDDDFQFFFDMLTSLGWKIIYYNETSHGQSGDKEMLIHITTVCENIQRGQIL